MQPLVFFSDVEAWAVGYLQSALDSRPELYAAGVYVTTAVPVERQPRMVILRRDGGPRTSVATEVARLGVRVWAETDETAADLTQLVRALLAASPGEGPIRAYVETAGPSYLTEESGQPLRFFTAELTARSAG